MDNQEMEFVNPDYQQERQSSKGGGFQGYAPYARPINESTIRDDETQLYGRPTIRDDETQLEGRPRSAYGETIEYDRRDKLSPPPSRRLWRPVHTVVSVLLVIALLSIGFRLTHLTTATVEPAGHTVRHIQPIPPPPITNLIGQSQLIANRSVVTLLNRDSCSVEFGGKVTVVAGSGNNLVVQYTRPTSAGSPPNSLPTGACPAGVRFSMSRDSFLALDGQYAARLSQIRQDQAEVKQILGQNYYGPVETAGSAHYVIVENPDPISNPDGPTYHYGDTCVVGLAQDGSTHSGNVQLRGTGKDGRQLYVYVPNGIPTNSECPAGTLFFNSSEG